MNDKHVPDDEFSRRLEAIVRHQIRQRNARASASEWWPAWSPRLLAATLLLVLLSMGIGGAVVAAGFQAQDNQRREAISAELRQRLEEAAQRAQLAKQQLQRATTQFEIGTGPEGAVQDARLQVTEADARLRSLQLDLEEVRVTAREPLNVVSAPLVSGRDFVTERWQAAITVPVATLERARRRLAYEQTRFDVGLAADQTEIARAREAVAESELGVRMFQRRVEVRQHFLRGEYDGGMAQLRLAEAELQLRITGAETRLQSAQDAARQLGTQVDIGTATALELAEGQLKVKEADVELGRLRYELLTVQKQIAESPRK